VLGSAIDSKWILVHGLIVDDVVKQIWPLGVLHSLESVFTLLVCGVTTGSWRWIYLDSNSYLLDGGKILSTILA
jgi:hypothetical protein